MDLYTEADYVLQHLTDYFPKSLGLRRLSVIHSGW